MVAVLSCSPPRGFTKLDNVILLDSRLTPDARLLLGILAHHARGKGVCYLGYPRICLLLGVTEKTARRRVRELEAADLIRVERPGWGRVNRYHLLSPEREILPSPEREPVPIIEREGLEEERRAMPVDTSMHAPLKIDVDSEKSVPCHASRLYDRDHATHATIRAVMEVVARETNDAAPLAATTTRALRTFRRADITLDAFVDACDAARGVTKERATAIRAVDTTTGRKRKTGYFFACLEDRLGLRAAHEERPSTREGAEPLAKASSTGTAHAPPMDAPQALVHKKARGMVIQPGREEEDRYVHQQSSRAPLAPSERHLSVCLSARDWPADLTALGIHDLPAYINICKRGLFSTAEASVTYARGALGRSAERRRV